MAKAKAVIKDVFDEIEVAQETQEGVVSIWGNTYLPVQWQNLTGQWECPYEHWAASMLEFDHDVVQVRHGSNMVDGFLLDSISLAPFAIKTHWGYKDPEGKYIAADEPDWSVSDAWRSRVHILALMKEAESLTPIILTAGSNTGKHLLANVGKGQQRIKNMLKKIERPDVPSYLFWMEMLAGPPVTVGEGETSQVICPPIAPPPAKIRGMTPKAIAKHLTDIYVGYGIRDLFNDSLLAESQEWAAKQPERLQLGDGNGGDSAALPAPTDASVMADGTLWLPDLSEAKPTKMKACGMSIPGLFSHPDHAANAFTKVMRDQRIGGATDADKWEAWRVELEKRWADKVALDADIAREIEERGAMGEVEADAEEIPPAFR